MAVPPSCHIKQEWMLLCLTICACVCVGCYSPPQFFPVVFQCRQKLLKFLPWHSSVGQFQLSFSRGVPVYPANICWVAQWYPSVHWVNQWHSSVHWTSQCTLAQGKGWWYGDDLYLSNSINKVICSHVCKMLIKMLKCVPHYKMVYFHPSTCNKHP